MNRELIAIFEHLEKEKGIKRELVAKAIEDALVLAARKGNKHMNNVTFSVNAKTGEISAIAEKEIVEHVEYPSEEVSLEEARLLDPNCQVGDWIDLEIDPKDLGRIAASVARQLISQRIRGAERDVIYEEYRHRMGEIISGTVRRVGRGRTVIVDLGKVEGLLPGRFYPEPEKYHIGDRVLALLYQVQDTENGGAEVVLSRSHPEFVKALFEQEVPEVNDGTIIIEKIVREAGTRTKIVVSTTDPKLDPVGACVGVRGSRIKNVIRELNNEKIDVVPFIANPIEMLKRILSPVVIQNIYVDDENDSVLAIVSDEDYPIALGKKGTNARLTGEIIGHELEIRKSSEFQKELSLERKKMSLIESEELDAPLASLPNMNQLIVDSFVSGELDTPRKILKLGPLEIAEKTGISIGMAETVLEQLRKHFSNLI
ncbi:MAG: transcription termination factor NusA [Chlamydiae bacterium RIFCSPHIGHO2_12_FULL_49_11]|nr:MAG: transcription termination factor NusA [Chlamydiae bacterium RIFCSPHIGHO2_12_FULL_49_11]